MTDEICGADCADGTPCQHPAGSCPVDTHNPDETGGAGGRPTKFTDDRKDDILEAARNGTTVEGCARAAGIHHSTLYDWLDKYSEFSEAFERARAEGEQALLEDVVDEDPKFVLERSYDYVKTERREVDASHEHTGEGGGPIQVEISETIVETPHSETEED